MIKAYEVQVTFNIKKTYTVVADSEDEAIEKLTESGIVSSVCESANEYYNEEYDVRRKVEVKEPDVE
jgi:hypothetical protein